MMHPIMEQSEGTPQGAERPRRTARRPESPTPHQLQAVLQGGKICLFSQDRDLRYTWVSGPIGPLAPAEVLGRTDDDLPPGIEQEAAVAAKRRVIESEIAADSEFSCNDSSGRSTYSLHIEPAFDADGNVQGIICAALETTSAKEREAHLQLLLREITHRSKNLLAVIQGMARQTARYSGSIGTFLELFSARLQALSHSHDLLVKESWRSASLHDLIDGQFGRYLERDAGRLTLEGPAVWLRPEAAQTVGLALHELAANAAKFGSLSRASGKVSVLWRWLDDGALEILWAERGGPKVGSAGEPGFGSLVLQKSLPRALDAKVDIDFRPDGLRCRIVVPAAQLTVPAAPERFPVAPR